MKEGDGPRTILGSIVEPAADLLTVLIPNLAHCGPVGPKMICHNRL